MEREPLVVVMREAAVDALQDGPAECYQVCSSGTLEALADLTEAFAPWGHQGTAC